MSELHNVCIVRGCTDIAAQVMCPMHWAVLTPDHKNAIAESWEVSDLNREGQEVYEHALRAACAYIEHVLS